MEVDSLFFSSSPIPSFSSFISSENTLSLRDGLQEYARIFVVRAGGFRYELLKDLALYEFRNLEIGSRCRSSIGSFCSALYDIPRIGDEDNHVVRIVIKEEESKTEKTRENMGEKSREPGKIRSNSTGRFLIRFKLDNNERFTLRLSEERREQVAVNAKLKITASMSRLSSY
ncbi:hypothetical protein AKJ16_DCAP16481 [Drosera capensis]